MHTSKSILGLALALLVSTGAFAASYVVAPDDVFARIPEGSRFLLPCNAYGCV